MAPRYPANIRRVPASRPAPRFLPASHLEVFPVVAGARPATGDRMSNFLVADNRFGSGSLQSWDPNQSENPDEVMRSRYGNVFTYQEMAKNPHVKAATQAVKGEVLKARYDVVAADEDPRNVEIADWVRWCLDPQRRDFILDLWEMLECFEVGYSLTAKIWDEAPAGRWAGKWYIREFRTKNPIDWKIIVDEFRNVLGYREAWLTDGPLIPPHLVVLLTWDPKHGNPYGTAGFQAVRADYEAIVFLTKKRLIWMETFAQPVRKGKVPAGTDKDKRQEFLTALQRWRDNFVMVHDSTYEVDVIDAITGSGDAYQSALDHHARNVAIGLRGAHLQTMEGGSQGSRAAAETHREEASTPAALAWMMLESQTARQIIKELVDWNYAGVTDYPRLVKVQEEEEVSETQARANHQQLETAMLAAEAGAEIPVRWITETLKYPSPEAGEPTIQPRAKPMGGLEALGLPPMDGLEVSDEEEGEEDEEGAGEDEAADMEARPELDPPVPRGTSALVAPTFRAYIREIAQAEVMSRRGYAPAARRFLQQLETEFKKKRRMK